MAMYEKQQQLVDKVTDQMSICADMLGQLNETESEKKLRDRIQNITQGIFQVMFTGTYNSGKSTILNALMHTDRLATGNLPETAVITKIIFKSEDECAIIYKKELDDKGQPITIVMKNLEEFFKEYHVDQKDTEKFLKTIDHVVIHQKGSGIAGSMVQLVDSPGTRASEADDEVALSYAEKADALVFMINAEVPLDKNDKEYIAKHFAGKQKENVFFVVNKINLLNSDEEFEELKDYVQSELKLAFTDKEGMFDKDLFDSRVFYVDAFGAMNTRLGRETPITRKYKTMVPEEETHIPEFERSLAAYLGAGDRDKKALAAYRSQMADFYMIAEESKRKQLELLSKGKDEIKAELEKFKKEKEKIDREIQDISYDIESIKMDVLRDARDVYDEYVNSIENGWEEYFSDKADGMGVHTYKLLLAKAESMITFWKDKSKRESTLKEKTDTATQEFADGIKEFMDLKSNEMTNNFTIKLNARMNTLRENLERHQLNLEKMDLPIDIDRLIESILRENNVPVPENGGNGAKLGQALVAILLADPELVVTAGGGKANTLDFLIDVIKTNVIDVILASILTAVLGNFVGIFFFIVTKIVKAESRGEEMTKKMIAETMDAIINGATDMDGNPTDSLKKSGKEKYRASTETKIGGAMRRANEALTSGIKEQLCVIERQLKDAYTKLSEKEDVYAQEEARMQNVLNSFVKAVSKMSELTTGEALDVNGIVRLSSTSAK